MIDPKDREVGTWYDGFLWKNGKQQGVACMQWTGAYYTDMGGQIQPYDPEYEPTYVTFEANVVSIGEPAG